jgi:hypothetical protein
MATTGHDLSRTAWRKSTHSGSGNCIETAPVTSGIAVRDSANPYGSALAFTRRAWSAFTAILKNLSFGLRPSACETSSIHPAARRRR